MSDINEQRINALEVKISFLEEALSTLSDEFYQQQLNLVKLQSQNEKLIAKVTEIQNPESNLGFSLDEKPPHY